MVKYTCVALAALASVMLGGQLHYCNAFVPSSLSSTTKSSTTQLHVIGPMLRKMKEEQEKKKMPMASPDEAYGEAPGLRVGESAWKWPPVWPYDADFFKRKDEIPKPNALGDMQGMLTGMPTMPNVADLDKEEEDKLDVMEYWVEEKGEEKTDLDPEAVQKLKSHYSFYLRDGQSILELGAAEDSYLPDNVTPSRHVGVGASQKLMEQNPSLTQTLVADLNDVEVGTAVKSAELRALASEPFDVVIMANTIDFLTSPREVFRTAWYLLKPGGTMFVPFSSKDAAYSARFDKAQTKMWRDMNDDQHMWICGSFFNFSAGDGWEGLKGFDCSPEGAQDINDEGNFLTKLLNKGKPINMYIVQATKGKQDDNIDSGDPEKSFRSKMWMLPTMEQRDKELVAPRLGRAYAVTVAQQDKDKIVEHVDTLPKVYESLIKMDQFAFTFNMQAQLAADLVADPDFDANEEQIQALKEGLGLRKPSAEFWEPVGSSTAAMDAEDKVNLLAHMVPRFGSENPEQEAALESFVSGLTPTFSVIRSKCPSLDESDVQLLGSELLAAEILKPGRSTRSEFAAWLGALEEKELLEILDRRKSFKKDALEELEQFKMDREEKEARLEATRKLMEEQIETARKERTMAFNPQTGKFEPIKK